MIRRICCVVALLALAFGAHAGLTTASTNDALSALPSTSGSVLRLGYHALGDTPPLSYTASASACTLNSGSGDGGSQVPTSDGRCWIASFPAAGVDVREFGAVCQSFNGAANDVDDTVAIRNALAFAGTFATPATVSLPGAGNKLCKVSGELIVGQGVTFTGAGPNSIYSGLVVGAAKIPILIEVSGNTAAVTSMYIDAIGQQAQSAAGVTIAIDSASTDNDTIRDVFIKQPCFGLTISGSRHHIDNLTIAGVQGPSCVGIQVGGSTIHAGSDDIEFRHVKVWSYPPNPASACMNILDAGGLFVEHSDMLWCSIGTRIKPGANQWFNWGFIHDTVLGDTGVKAGLEIDTSAATSEVEGLTCVDCWFSSQTAGSGATIKNAGGGTVTGLDFNSARALANIGVGIDIEPGVTGLTVENSQICASAGAAGIYLAAGAGEARIVNNTITPTCDGRPRPRGSTSGILLTGSNANLVISGNDLRGNSTGLGGSSPTGASVVENNIDPAGAMPTIPSATSIALPPAWNVFQITGSTAIVAIAGGWSGRVVTLITTEASISLPGCVPFSSNRNVPAVGVWYGCWWWK